MKDTSAPQSPDPAVSIPLQGQENRRSFDYQLGQMRTNSFGPTGSVTWERSLAPWDGQWGRTENIPTTGGIPREQALALGVDPRERQRILEDSADPPGGPSDPSGASSAGGVGAGGPSGDPGGGGPSDPPPGTVTPGPAIGPNGLPIQMDPLRNYTWTQRTVLSPEQQALYDTNTRNQQGQADVSGMLTNQIKSGLGSPLDLSGLTDAAGYSRGLADRSVGDNFSNTLSDAAYRQQTRYLDPQMDQQRQALQANLADQGFVPGTPGYDRAMQNFMDTSNRAYGSARDSAIGQGFDQGNKQLGLQNQIAQLLSGIRGQGVGERLTMRNQPLNELASLRSGTGVQMPQGATTGATPNLMPTDIMGALNQQYQGQLGQYGANVSSNNQLMSGLGGLLSMFLMGSDIRLKKNLRRVGQSAMGHNWYRWEWKWGGVDEGVIAQEVMHIPGAVFTASNGILVVDYMKV